MHCMDCGNICKLIDTIETDYCIDELYECSDCKKTFGYAEYEDGSPLNWAIFPAEKVGQGDNTDG